jgi:outer membrane protein assembly factor BamE (lipoprotein component of BamABCDE complex)
MGVVVVTIAMDNEVMKSGIILIGPVGTGKSTQGKLPAEKPGFQSHTGDEIIALNNQTERRRMKNLRMVWTLSLLLVIGVMAGCASRKIGVLQEGALESNRIASRQEYSKIQTGMTQAEVTAIIGSGGVMQISSGTHDRYDWVNSDGSKIVIYFKEGRVTTKAWYGPSKRLRLP